MAEVISYQPWHVGQTFPYWKIPLTTDGGVDDITNVAISNFSLWFRTLNGAETQGTGTFTAFSTNPAYLTYEQSVADVAAAFTGYIVLRGLYPPSNSTADKPVFDPIPFALTV